MNVFGAGAVVAGGGGGATGAVGALGAIAEDATGAEGDTGALAAGATGATVAVRAAGAIGATAAAPALTLSAAPQIKRPIETTKKIPFMLFPFITLVLIAPHIIKPLGVRWWSRVGRWRG